MNGSWGLQCRHGRDGFKSLVNTSGPRGEGLKLLTSVGTYAPGSNFPLPTGGLSFHHTQGLRSQDPVLLMSTSYPSLLYSLSFFSFCGYTIMNISIHTTSRLSGANRKRHIMICAPRTHSHYRYRMFSRRARRHRNDTPAPIVSAVHAATSTSTATYDNGQIGTRGHTTTALAHRQRSAPRRATKRQPIHATGASLSIIRSLQHSSFGTLRQHARNGKIQSLTDLSVTAAVGRHRTRGSAATHLRRLPRRAVCLR